MWIMDIEELTAMIPSETVRNYVMESKWTFTDREKAALLYHSDLSLKEQYTRLGNLRDRITKAAYRIFGTGKTGYPSVQRKRC